MPVLHCKECHHEWEGRRSDRCDWCGAGALVLEAQSAFEKMLCDPTWDANIKQWVAEISLRDAGYDAKE